MNWSLEPGPINCDLDSLLLEALHDRGIAFAFNHSDRKIHVHLWEVYQKAVDLGIDFELAVEYLLMDGLMHEELHATFEQIGESNAEIPRAEEEVIKAMRKNGNWSCEL